MEVSDSTVSLSSNEHDLVLLIVVGEGHTIVAVELSLLKRGGEVPGVPDRELSLREAGIAAGQDMLRIAKPNQFVLTGAVVGLDSTERRTRSRVKE